MLPKVRQTLQDLRQNHHLRELRKMKHSKNFIQLLEPETSIGESAKIQEDRKKAAHHLHSHAGYPGLKLENAFLNLASNDYLGITQEKDLQQKFFSQNSAILSSSSSRSLSGNYEIFDILEKELTERFSPHAHSPRSALLFNSGYHANIGIIDALAHIDGILFLCDSYVHASIFDGLRLSRGKFFRYPHQDYEALQSLILQHRNKYEHILVLTESLFSMDGDFCDLRRLIELKKRFGIHLYVDCAHSFGIYGENMLGMDSCFLGEIDFILLAFGKAISSIGGAVICHPDYKSYFVNKARSLIYSTAIPPLNVAWSHTVITHLKNFEKQKSQLLYLSDYLKKELQREGIPFLGDSHIISILAYDNASADDLANFLRICSIFCPAIKSPTVPQNLARIRLSLRADLEIEEIDYVISSLKLAKKLGILKGKECKSNF